ncbi:acetyl-CoA synthetase-like protein [Cystobasidium minutum MCA 4210]|uniref:acetyl-CoA synthetase-like protein n=1 Tax=Cystobasidium minutum MCA 4210 TaxID=1397322 RepID=UPI0034CD2556|eukprot:jgi/Rhomi1/192607/gm1.821_g
MTPSDPLFPIPIPLSGDDVQAREVPGTQTSESTGAYRLTAFPQLITLDSNPEFPRTVFETFERSLRLRPDRPCFGWRAVNATTGELANEYTWMSNADVDKRRQAIGSGMMELAKRGIIDTAGKTTGWTVANWMVNRPEWQLVHLAACSYSLPITSLYDTLGPGVVEYCINHAEAKVVFASPNHIPALLDLAGERCPGMKLIVSVDNWNDIDLKWGGRPVGGLLKKDALVKWGKTKGVTVMDLAEVEKIGKDNLMDFIPPSPDSAQSILYTSGTTGNPKGVTISHRNIVSASIGQLHGQAETEAGDVALSYLPLSHIYEQFVEVLLIMSGMGIGYSCGDITRLIEDIQILKPHSMVAVPRVLNRFYQVVKAATLDGPGLKGSLSRKAFNSALEKLESAEPSLPSPYSPYDMLVFRKVRLAFGGRLKFLSSGSAPIAPEVLKFFRVALGRQCKFVEGYGQTEGMGTATRCLANDLTCFGYVGPPLPCCEMKLLDVPDMGYLHTDLPYPRGEILFRGENIFKGYLRDEKNTKETLDSDGWLHSGDIGEIDAKGRLKIIDRKKNLLKLSQGEYVALEKVENTYALSPIVAQIYVHGDSLRDHLVAVVVPEPVAFGEFLRKMGKSPSSDAAAAANTLRDPEVIEATFQELSKYHVGKLNGFEQIKQIHLSPVPFPDDLITPTLKIKRNVAGKHFRDVIDKLYDQGVSAKRPSKL